MNLSALKYYHHLTLSFTVILLLSNIAEIKICDFLGFSIGAGTLIFPLLYVLNDILTEVYGFTAARRVIWTALTWNCIFTAFIYIILLLPSSPHFEQKEAFEQIFFISPRIVLASIFSYFVGELLNSSIIATLKVKFQGRFFALRAIFSTLISSACESSVFAYIAFSGRIPNMELVEMVILLTLIKVAYEILIMPFTLKFTNFLKRSEGVNIFEKPSWRAFIPFF
jgi:uncharacterized integral membrane protein (TIGR00697 family)